MTRVVMLMLLSSAVPSLEAQGDRVGWVDHAMLSSSSALIVADWLLTMDGLHHGYRETNPLIGPHPSKARATVLIGLGLLANVAVLKLPSPTLRRVIWTGVIIAEAHAVYSMATIGLRFRLP